jgi:hypothetical protein
MCICLRVKEEAVHVEETGADWGKLGRSERVVIGLADLLCTRFCHCQFIRYFISVSKEEDAIA